MANFDLYGRYYDALYGDKDYIAESNYIGRILRNHGVESGEVLEFGCGTGIHGRLLGEMGFRVHGVDLSHQMIELARHTENFSCEQGDIRNVSLCKTFDAVISLFHVMSYQVSNESVSAVFEKASMHLASGGLFVFDFWYQPAVLMQRPESRFKRIKTSQTTISRFAEPTVKVNENLVDVSYTILVSDADKEIMGEIHETHSMRYFSLPEVEFYSGLYGFKMLSAEEFLSGNVPSSDTWGVCVVLQKV